jgi:hypothetical protein
MANDELINVFLQALRQQEKTFREVVREEVNAAVYASEQRVKNPIPSRGRAWMSKPCLTSLSLVRDSVGCVRIPTGAYSSL